jgi:7-cyano-7-deazaguanine synthase
MDKLSRPPIGLLLSGGLDSSILLVDLLRQGCRVQPFYVDSQLFWQDVELKSARRFLEALGSDRLADLVVLRLPLADLYDEHWSVTGRGVPPALTSDEAVYLPGRNALLLIKTRLWCQMHGIDQLALGSLGTNPFADATDEFFQQFESVLDRATSGHVQFVRPFATADKRQVMHLGRSAPLGLTFSCLAPQGGLHCGRCNKCAERRAAFRLIEMPDPTRYAPAPRQVAI